MKLHYYFDQEADILYFSQGKPSATDKTRETTDDVLLRLDANTGKVRGFTILNFTRRLKRKDTAVSLPLDAQLTPLGSK